MNTIMQKSAFSTFKKGSAGLASAVILATGGYVVGTQSTDAASAASNSTITQASSQSNDGLIVSAIDYYMGQQSTKLGLPYVPQQVSKIDVSGNNARAYINNGDSGSVAYLHNSDSASKSASTSGWTVVTAGQMGLDQATATQYKMPQSWVHVVPTTNKE